MSTSRAAAAANPDGLGRVVRVVGRHGEVDVLSTEEREFQGVPLLLQAATSLLSRRGSSRSIVFTRFGGRG